MLFGKFRSLLGGERTSAAGEMLAEKNRKIKGLRERLQEKDRDIQELRAGLARGDQPGGIRSENVVWMFGAGRSGSTWLSDMMKDLPGHQIWFEPRVGTILDPRDLERRRGKHFVFSADHSRTWLANVRDIVLDGANARFRKDTEVLVIKEPGGSMGAPWLMEALPESRIILLIRDPRDVVASWMDAVKKDSWAEQRAGSLGALVSTEPDTFVRRHAEVYLNNVGHAARAFEAHAGRKALVRYEDLRADTLGTMQRMYGELGIAVGSEELTRVIERHSWEAIPEEKKGEGKFYRKGAPGSWREDLTPEQARIVEEVNAQILERHYPG